RRSRTSRALPRAPALFSSPWLMSATTASSGLGGGENPLASRLRAVSRARSGRDRFRLQVVTMLLGQVSQQHFAHQRRALGFPDHEHAVDDEGAVDLLLGQLEMELVGERQ